MEEISDLACAQHIKMDYVQFCENCSKYIISDKFTYFWIIFSQFLPFFSTPQNLEKIYKWGINLKFLCQFKVVKFQRHIKVQFLPRISKKVQILLIF